MILRHALPILCMLGSLLAMGQKPAQPVLDYAYPREYEIGGLTVSGCVTRDANAVKLFSGLQVGDKVMIPGDRISEAILNIWEQHLFSDVRIEVAEVRGGVVFLNIEVKENPQIALSKVRGVSKSDEEKLNDVLRAAGSIRGRQVDDALLTNTRNAVARYYQDKGYPKATTRIEQITVDSTYKGSAAYLPNSVQMVYHVDRGPRVRIKDVVFAGNDNIKDARLRRAMKNTKRKRWYNIFGSSKFLAKDFKADQRNVIEVYNENGFRNAAIVKDTVYYVSDDKVRVEVTVDEDHRFYYRHVSFSGNTKHTSTELGDILNIRRGDRYNKKTLDSRLYMNPSGRDISSLYMDDGYLGFQPNVTESVEGDSIDLAIRIREGRQYRIRNVIIKGNTKTNEHVIRREIYTKPGDLFNRSDVLRTQRELAQLGYFDPEKLGVNPIQDARTGMVDLEYTVEEKPSDRLELSGGFGANRLVLSLGVSFTNFSMRKMFDKEAWQPLPAGDGQTLNLRAVTNGSYYQQYSLSFVEPWLGGRKPNSLSVSAYLSKQTNGITDKEDPTRQVLRIFGSTIGFGKRLQVPDDYFIWRISLGYQLYDLNNWQSLFNFSDGQSNVISLTTSISRNSVDAPFFARSGSDITLSVKATPPYSRIFFRDRDYTDLSDADRYQWAEFHKWKFTTQWYQRLTRSKTGHELVLMARAGFGFLGRYDRRVGDSPFERFYLGGVPLSGFALDGREIIYLRGYEDYTISNSNGSGGDLFITKYATELRFPISLNPQATIYALGFLEAANSWNTIDRYDPFRLYRSAGLGLRLFLPMFGPMGLDYGWRLDDVPAYPNMAKGQFHFTIGIDLGEL